MIKWLIKSKGAGSSGIFNEINYKGAVAEEVGSKSYNEIFCDNAKICQNW
jgi:hypothetical protein